MPAGSTSAGIRARSRAWPISPDGRQVASAGEDGTVRIWDAGDGPPRPDPARAMPRLVYAVAFSPDGNLLASADIDPSEPGMPGELRLWEAATGDPLRTLQAEGTPARPGASHSRPDGRRLAAASGPFTSPATWSSGTWRRPVGSGSSAGMTARSPASPSAPTGD